MQKNRRLLRLRCNFGIDSAAEIRYNGHGKYYCINPHVILPCPFGGGRHVGGTVKNAAIAVFTIIWGYSSAGRALEWHSRGQRFDPAYLHQKRNDDLRQKIVVSFSLKSSFPDKR